MKASAICALLLAGLAVCEWFTVKSRDDIIFLEEGANEGYTEYAGHKEEYTITKGTVTSIYNSKQSAEGLDKLLQTNEDMCFIEFTTSDGVTISDHFFPCDTDNDTVGRTVDIAYKLTPMVKKNHVDAARTEYIKSTKQLRRNTYMTAGFGIGIAAALGGLIISVKRK